MLWTAHKRNMPKSEPIPLKDVPRIVLEALWGLVTVVIIIGGILSGVFTPTESAAVACVYAFLVTFFVYRDYKWRDLPHLVHRVVKTVAMVMMLIGFSVAFGYMMAMMQIPAKITAFFLSISENKYVFLMLVNILLLVLGTFMDLAPMLLICTPIFLPVIAKLGIDPVHFGMIMILNLGIGLITPPVGPTLFVGCAIGKVTIEQVIEGAMAVLRRDVHRAAAGDLHPGHLALASGPDEMNLVKQKLAAGEPVLGSMVFEFFTPGIARICANAGAEFVMYCMEHTGAGYETLKPQFALCRALGIAPLVRVPATEYHFVARALDIGALGVMVPLVDTREQAERIVSFTRYPPKDAAAPLSASRTTTTRAAMWSRKCAPSTSARW